MNLEQLRQHLDARLDKIEDKIDNHLERITKAESDVTYLKGYAKISLTILLSVTAYLAQEFFK